MDRKALTIVLAASLCALAAIVAWGAFGPGSAAQEKGVRLVRDDAKQRVDVFVDGQPFTAYIWPATQKKPVLFPLRTAKGTLVTRGFPLDPRPGERVDHPHHVGLWFNYGDVNGADFWNNTDAVKPEDRPKFGTIVHRAVTAVRGGAEQGELEVDMDWIHGERQAWSSRSTRCSCSAAGLAGAAWTASRACRRRASAWRSPTTRKACWACASRASSRSPRTKPEVFTDAQRPRRRRCRRSTTPASTATT